MTKSNNEWVPEVGEFYQHHSGSAYEVISIANSKSTDLSRFPLMVNYRNISNGDEWVRPLSDFIKSFSPIKTEAEKRREKLQEQLIRDSRYCGNGFADHINTTFARHIIDAGWIKPKPLTEKVVFELITVGLECKVIAERLNAYIRGDLKP